MRILNFLKKIRFIRFQLIVHIYQESTSTEVEELAPLGTSLRIQQTSDRQVEYRRLHKAAVTAYDEAIELLAAVHVQEQPLIATKRLEEKIKDGAEWH